MKSEEEKQLVQEVINHILYCDVKYQEELKALNDKYHYPDKVKFTTNIGEFMFPLEQHLL